MQKAEKEITFDGNFTVNGAREVLAVVVFSTSDGRIHVRPPMRKERPHLKATVNSDSVQVAVVDTNAPGVGRDMERAKEALGKHLRPARRQ